MANRHTQFLYQSGSGAGRQLRHVGIEDEAKEGFSSDFDTNGLEWEHFSPGAQDQKIVEMYGVTNRESLNTRLQDPP